jgi:hypothetical protein
MFETKGDRAQWRTVYDHVSTLKVGDVVTDETLVALLPDAAPSSYVGAFHRAVKELEAVNKRTFDRVRGKGYRMVEAVEHANLAKRQHRRAKRRLAAAHSKAHSADRSRLTPEERQRIDAIEMNLAQQQQLTKRLETRVERLQQGLQEARREHKQDIASVSERVDRLAEQLARAGVSEPAGA